jgi:NACHT domain
MVGRQRSGGSPPNPAAASSGGRANEAGSVYRAGVAAYLAAHGLAGRGVEAAGYPEGGPAPVRLSFETGESVDDIRCDLADGTVLRLQAKRECGDDKHLAATVAQWAGQVHDLSPGDMIGLATAEPKGDVKQLGPALERRRRSVPGPHPTGEEKALASVQRRLPPGLSAEAADQVLQSAFVMTVTVSTSRDEGFRSVANLMDGKVVAVGSGSSAIEALQSACWKQAKAGTGSGINDWLQILAEAKLPVFPNAAGPAGPRRQAELDAVTAYRARLAARDGVLEYSLLADAMPTMMYKPLAESFRATAPGRGGGGGDQFLFLARRWPRMLLTGLPGMGKSTALEQAAARWAADPTSLIPVIVPLREIARRSPRSGAEVTLPVLIEAATTGVPAQEGLPLRRALEEAAASGQAVLLLDGLDECRDRRAVVADGLAVVIRDLPPETGVILTTRDSAVPAAERLNLPEARLAEPFDLDAVRATLLRHAACRVPAANRDHWLRDRQQQLDEVESSHYELFDIPLFAILLTLLLAQPERQTTPRGKAQLLSAAVRDTVQQWEFRRLLEGPGRSHASADQILDGFAAISHAYVNRPGACDVTLTCRQVEAMLKERWGLSAGEARERAREILWFWDEHVGVFTVSAVSGEVEARSRVFAEIGEAMWAATCDSGDLRTWVIAALDDDDNREPVLLACGLSEDIANEVIKAAQRASAPPARARSLLWAADAVAEGARPSIEALTYLIDELADAAGQADKEESRLPEPRGRPRQGEWPGWQYVLRLAMLHLPSALRPRRGQLVRALVENDYEQVLAESLVALADARADASRTLEPGQMASVKTLLALPFPEGIQSAASASVPSGKYEVSRKEILPGHQEAAQQAVRYATQLGKEAVGDIYRITMNGGFFDYRRISSRLDSLGFRVPDELRVSLDIPAFAGLSEIGDIREMFRDFFKVAESLAPPRSLSHGERWRYPGVAILAGAVLAEHGTIIGVHHALTAEQPTLRGCMIAAAHAADLDLPGIAAEAALALEAWPSGKRDAFDIIFSAPPARPTINVTHLDTQDKEFLLEALGAASDWLASIAREFLLDLDDPEIGERAAKRVGNLAANRRSNAVLVSVANDSSPADAASRFLDSSDPPVRAGAATAARMLAQADTAQPWADILMRALNDDDKSVRKAAGADLASLGRERYWECGECGHANKEDVRECNGCGCKPRLRVISERPTDGA